MGQINSYKEGITILISFIFVVILHFIWYKYIRKNEALNTNKKFGSLAALWLGIIIGVAVYSLLMSLPD